MFGTFILYKYYSNFMFRLIKASVNEFSDWFFIHLFYIFSDWLLKFHLIFFADLHSFFHLVFCLSVYISLFA